MNILKHRYARSASLCYLDYFLYGMAYIILAQNMSFLGKQFQVDSTDISFLIALFGLGRLCTVFVDGILVDRLGRKRIMIAGCLLMIVFLVGVPLSPSYQMAMFFSLFGGFSIGCLDTSTYPSLIEFFPNNAGIATVVLKLIVSFGSSVLPLVTVFCYNRHLFLGIPFFAIALVFLISAVFLFRSSFPDKNSAAVSAESPPNIHFVKKPNFWLDGTSLILIGFTAPGLLYLMQTWLPTYGQKIIGMGLSESLKLVSFYNVGAILSVIGMTFLLAKGIKPVTFLLAYPVLSILATIGLMGSTNSLLAQIAAFFIGVFTAGIFQLCLTVICQFFWNIKGKVTGAVDTATGIAQAGIPFITGIILRYGTIHSVFVFSLIINIIAVFCGLFINYRYRKLLRRSVGQNS
ncbi:MULTISPECIES: MFS transporter [unclassified Sporolactobacillus]|uniref:MFS transporter n=1 Tax=unclassified Sporolactobacillus TaxID=2628533 RepID=UPI0023683494|nr:MFS transporter [Sporolactobacillus sp. CQH2019]MDD9149195.1 MFS transporter [Sporolactobacillus sp. CQH2019]